MKATSVSRLIRKRSLELGVSAFTSRASRFTSGILVSSCIYISGSEACLQGAWPPSSWRLREGEVAISKQQAAAICRRRVNKGPAWDRQAYQGATTHILCASQYSTMRRSRIEEPLSRVTALGKVLRSFPNYLKNRQFAIVGVQARVTSRVWYSYRVQRHFVR